MDYWETYDEQVYISELIKRYASFHVDSIIADQFHDRDIKVIMAVGGGMLGGALSLYSKSGTKVLVDVLGEEFSKLGKISSDILICSSDFNHIPFASNTIDIIFAWDVLDHALSWRHFQQGQAELVRLLAFQGLLFVRVPIRREGENVFHIPTPDKNEIMEGFKDLCETGDSPDLEQAALSVTLTKK